MAEINRPHSRLPFITLTVDRPTAGELAQADIDNATGDFEFLVSPQLTAHASISNDYLIYPYGPAPKSDDEQIFADLAHDAERRFFTENGSFLFLRGKALEARDAGDVQMLCLLAEGFGYWRGATEAHDRASEYHVLSLDPSERLQSPPPPLSFFDKLADPPTILADYHEQKRKK